MNRALARVEMLQSQIAIAEEQLGNERQSLERYKAKYKQMRAEFRKMKQKYELELISCVEEMESLRIIVTDVVSQKSEPKRRASGSSKQRQKMKVKPIQFVQSSTGEPALLHEADHTQSERVLDLPKRTFNAYRDDTTSSESPVRGKTLGLQPLVKSSQIKRSARFSSHEQFSISSSQNQTARFSLDLSKNNSILVGNSCIETRLSRKPTQPSNA